MIKIRKLLHSLRTECLSETDVPLIEAALPSLPEDLSWSLLRAMFGMYTDTEIDSRIRDNIKLVAKSVWDVSPVDARREAGVKQATLAVNGEAVRANLAREFIEVVKGLDFLTDSILATEISTALDSLATAHNGWDNFHNEPAPARLLHRLILGSGDAPKAVRAKYVKTLTMCSIGNGHGVSWAAEKYYADLMSRFSDSHIFTFINLIRDQEVASRLRFRDCAIKYQSLSTKLNERAVRARLKEMLTFIVGYAQDRLHDIPSDAGFNQLQRTQRA